jgi:hypothetical protein
LRCRRKVECERSDTHDADEKSTVNRSIPAVLAIYLSQQIYYYSTYLRRPNAAQSVLSPFHVLLSASAATPQTAGGSRYSGWPDQRHLGRRTRIGHGGGGRIRVALEMHKGRPRAWPVTALIYRRWRRTASALSSSFFGRRR